MAETQIRFEDRRVGSVFLDWLAPPAGLKWIDVGCGNGAFTELLVQECAPTEIVGVDPSQAQLDFARKRSAARPAKFDRGDAMALPFAADTFDAAVMALVIFFVPDPAKGVAEMVRAPGRPGCSLRLGHSWRRFHHGAAAYFEDFWATSLLGSSIRPIIAAMPPADVELLKTRVRARLPADATGRITYEARANAVKGRMPRNI